LRRRILGTLFAILLMVALLTPFVSYLSTCSSSGTQNDLAQMIEPMAALLDEGPQHADIPVEPVIEIEDCWDIEDTRTYADAPLVRAMRRGDSALGYDEASNTFYCTLGSDINEDWPEITLFAKGSEDGMRVAWVDDYTYDFCADAVREGYRYELMAYTDEEYDYFGVVFTSLPIVTIHTQSDAVFSESYIPARICVSSAGHDAVISAGQVHLRGGGFDKPIDKSSYRIELYDLSEGMDEKRRESLLGMDADSDWLLLANAQDPTAVRNALCYDMWRRWNEDTEVPMKLQEQFVEVFVQDEYMGIYQLAQRVQPERELIRFGGNPLTDSVVRVVVGGNAGEKPTLNVKESTNMWIEYRYDAQGQPMRAFQRFMDFARLSLLEGKSLSAGGYMNDDEFSALAEKTIPVTEMMSYYLFSQVCGLDADNVFNNLYIWMLEEDGQVRYQVSPWDMDRSLQGGYEDGVSLNFNFIIPCRMLTLNTAGCREEIGRIWQEKLETLLTSQALYDWLIGMEEKVNATGAYLRESEKWYGEAQPLSLEDVLYNTEIRLNKIENLLLSNEWRVDIW